MERRAFGIAFIVALLIGYGILATIGAFVQNLKVDFLGKRADMEGRPMVLSVPPNNEVLQELTQKQATFDNVSRNFTGHGIGIHSSFAVEPDDFTGYALRPNIKVNAYFLRPLGSNNTDPPLLYLNGHLNYSDNA